jgi:hypothetical protein
MARNAADLLLEVADRIVVGVGEKVLDPRMRRSNVVLEVVHEVRAIAL